MTVDSASFVEGYKSGLQTCLQVLESPEEFTVSETISAIQLALAAVEMSL